MKIIHCSYTYLKYIFNNNNSDNNITAVISILLRLKWQWRRHFNFRAVTEEPGWQEKQHVLRNLNTTTIESTSRNNTQYTSWLFYNRIPRSGGRTLVALLHALGSDLDYQHQEHVYRTPWQRLGHQLLWLLRCCCSFYMKLSLCWQ